MYVQCPVIPIGRALSISASLIFLVGLIILGRTIAPWFPQQLATVTSFSGGFYVDWGVFLGIGAAVVAAGVIVLWFRSNVEF